MFAFQAKYLPVLDLFAARDDVRWYLNGYCVAPHPTKGILLKATNGHVAAVIHDELGACENGPHILARSADLVRASRPKKFDVGKRWIYWGGARENRVVVVDNSDTPGAEVINMAPHIGIERWASLLPPPIVDGTYPSFEKILPDKARLDPGLLGPINSEYIALFDSAVKALAGNSGLRSVRSWTPRYDGERGYAPYIFQLAEAPEALFLIMPIRDDDAEKMPDIDAFREQIEKPKTKRKTTSKKKTEAEAVG